MRMLIIDDSRTMRTYLGAIANDLAIETEQAVDGRDALDRLEKSRGNHAPMFDVAMVDWDMPRMNGVEFVRAVRSQPEWASMKLMMVTSHTGMDDVRAAVIAGADDYLMKPLDGAMVAEKLQLMGLLD